MSETLSQVDTELFLKLFLKHEMDFRYYIASICPSPEACDEILQRSSIIMWRKFDQLRAEAAFKSWGIGIARLEALAYRRQMQKEKTILSDGLVEMLADEGGETLDRRDAEQTALKECFKRLNKKQQQLTAFYYQAANAKERRELAEAQGITKASLYKNLERIRKALHDCMTGKLTAMGYDL